MSWARDVVRRRPGETLPEWRDRMNRLGKQMVEQPQQPVLVLAPGDELRAHGLGVLVVELGSGSLAHGKEHEPLV